MVRNQYMTFGGKFGLPCLRLTRASFSRIAGITATITLIVCLSFTLVSQLVYPGYNPLQNTISELVWGPWGWLQTTAFYLLAFSVIMLGAKLYFITNNSIRYKIGVIILVLMGIGTIIVSLNPTDIPGSAQTSTGAIHMQSAAALLFLFPIACFLVAPSLKKNFTPKWVSRYTYIAGAAALALMGIIVVLVLGNHGFLGTMERLIMANGLMWIQIMHVQIL